MLEVLVAFSIMGMALAALYHAIGGSVRGFSDAERSVRATMVMEAILAQHPVVPPDGVDEAGESESGFLWRVTSAPYDVAEENPAWQLHRVEVVVVWQDRGRSREYRVATLRPVDVRVR